MRNRTRLSRITLGGLVSVLVLASGVAARPSFAQPVVAGAYGDVSLEVFDRALAPYGEWVTVGRFGRAWRPYATIVGTDFQPYLTGGHWVYTDYGWSFESDYDWGWAPFHYGRWMPDDYYGWVWVPDTVWGPAWVDWRFGGGYVGWAPLAPVGFSFGFGFGRPEWCFVPVTHFVVTDVYHYAVPVERLHWAYSVTSRIYQPVHYAGAQWNSGPPPGHVAQVTGHPIQPVSIAPPPPGRVQAVRLGPPSGVSTTVSSGAPGVRPLPPTASSGHPRDGAPSGPAFGNHAPSGAPSANNSSAAPSHGEPQWGHASAGDTRHWGHAPEGDTPRWGHAPEGDTSHMGHAPAGEPPHSGHAPAGEPPHSGHGAPGSVQMPPQPAPQPAPAAGHPTSGGFTPRTAPANQYVRPLSFPTSQPAPQYHAPPARAYAPPVFNAPNRASPPMAYRSAPSPQTFASVHSAPTPHFSAGHSSVSGGRGHR